MADAPKAKFANFLTPYSWIHTYTCADGNAISKGTLLQLAGDNTASKAQAWQLGTSATSGAFIGVAYHDKEAGDGSTTIAVLKEGRMDVRASGAINAGTLVITAGNDEVKAIGEVLGAQSSSNGLMVSMHVGIAEETASDGEVIIVRFVK